jgi:hypothetical protein
MIATRSLIDSLSTKSTSAGDDNPGEGGSSGHSSDDDDRDTERTDTDASSEDEMSKEGDVKQPTRGGADLTLDSSTSMTRLTRRQF